MQIAFVDGNGNQQIAIGQSVATPTDRSGTIAVGATSQQLMAPNALRSGWFIQNQSASAMQISEIGNASTAVGFIIIAAGQSFPPPGYPVTLGQINISGTAAAVFAAREW
jgi:hypothetical protein